MPAAAGFDADEFDVLVGDVLVEGTDGVRPAADAGDDRVGQTAFVLEDLTFRFARDDAVEVADHRRIRVRAECGAEDVEGIADIGDPVAHGFVDGVLERGGAGADTAYFSSQKPHAEDVQLLPAHVFFPHVDNAFHAKERADCGGGYAVLAGAGLGDDALLTHAASEQRLTQRIVDFVRAGVQQVLALEVDLCAAQRFAEAFGEVERRGAAAVVAEE